MSRWMTAATIALLSPMLLPAQQLRQQTSALQTEPPPQVISTNPFLPLWGFFQAEYERRINANATWAVASSYTNYNDAYYTNVDGKIRLYPNEHAPEGLGVAASVGIAVVRGDGTSLLCVPDGACGHRRQDVTVPTFAIEGGYQWLLGSHKATAVTAGFGVKRYFATESEFGGDSRVLPTGRLSIGYAFR